MNTKLLIAILPFLFCISAPLAAINSIEEMPSYTGEASIILINGLSCAGKSTLAKHLVDTLRAQGKTVQYHSIDDYVADSDKLWEKINALAGRLQMRRCDVNFWIFHERILRNKMSSDYVVVDHCMRYEPAYHNFFYLWNFLKGLHIYAKFDVALVKAHCSKNVALERLAERNNSSDERQHRMLEALDEHFLPNSIAGINFIEYDIELCTERAPFLLVHELITRLNETSPKAAKSNYWNMRKAIQEKYTAADAVGINLFNERR